MGGMTGDTAPQACAQGRPHSRGAPRRRGPAEFAVLQAFPPSRGPGPSRGTSSAPEHRRSLGVGPRLFREECCPGPLAVSRSPRGMARRVVLKLRAPEDLSCSAFLLRPG